MKLSSRFTLVVLASFMAMASHVRGEESAPAAVIAVKLDANGGKIGTASCSFVYDEESEMYACESIPNPKSRSGYLFHGWFSGKTGGTKVVSGDGYPSAIFESQTKPTLYAHWIKTYTVTLKDASAALYYWNEEYDLEGELNGKGSVSMPAGSSVQVSVDGSYTNSKGAELDFQKWSLTPSTAAMGATFCIIENESEFTMPAANIVLQATYVDSNACGTLSVVPAYYSTESYETVWYDPITLNVWETDEESGERVKRQISPADGVFKWSPDGGKTWYDLEDEALVKPGKYTITFRSQDSRWKAPSKKYTAKVNALYGTSVDIGEKFSYVYIFKPDIVTIRNGGDDGTGAGGTVTMNPKSGVYTSSLTLTAKAAKNFAFQGWQAIETYEGCLYTNSSRSASWKLSYLWVEDLNRMLDADDGKVHVQAIFKAISDYRAEDLVFNCLSRTKVAHGDDGTASVDLHACVGCAIDEAELELAAESYPQTYKLIGKLPDGIKFDSKKGKFTGVPTKIGEKTVTVRATDPAKHSADLKVNIRVRALPSWVAGNFRAIIAERSYYESSTGEWVYEPTGIGIGVVEASVSSAAKVSVKYINAAGSKSFSGRLTWYPNYDDPTKDGAFYYNGDDVALCLNGEGNLLAEVTSLACYDKTTHTYVVVDEGGFGRLVRFNKSDYLASPFKNKYYTFAMRAVSNLADESTYTDEELSSPTGYGYLTFKTDKTGGVKVTGVLPDGEKVSMSSTVLVNVSEAVTNAHVYVFSAPSNYKKRGRFAAELLLKPDGTVELTGDNTGWHVPSPTSSGTGMDCVMNGFGREYGSVGSLKDYYWSIFCTPDDGSPLDISDDAVYAFDNVHDFDGSFFDVRLKGNSKGEISLVAKSPAPYKKKDGSYDFVKDSKGKTVTDPSQLSFSFTKATGVFSGKATIYFDSGDKQKAASLPYNGVMISEDAGLRGYGAAVYSFKSTSTDEFTGTKVAATHKVSVPVSVEAEDGSSENAD